MRDEALKRYQEKFDDELPIRHIMYMTDEQVVELVDECIELNKNLDEYMRYHLGNEIMY